MSRQPSQNSSSPNPQLSGLAILKPHGILKSDARVAAMGKEKDKMPEVDQWGSLAPKMDKDGKAWHTSTTEAGEPQLVAPRGSLLRHLRPS